MTLMHVPNTHWIIVEDSDQQTRLVAKLLSGLESCKIGKTTQLNVRTPEQMRLSENEPTWRKNRGVEQRNLAIDWLRQQRADGRLRGRGVVYFADDDNTYDPVLFKEVCIRTCYLYILNFFPQMRNTVNVSVWLVGITGGLRFEGPRCKDGHVTGWNAEWGTSRTFPLDMAGKTRFIYMYIFSFLYVTNSFSFQNFFHLSMFIYLFLYTHTHTHKQGFAVNLDLLISRPKAYIDHNAVRGNLESSLLEHLTTREELEGRPSDCKKVRKLL